MKNWLKMTLLKDANKATINNPKEMKNYELSDKEFKIIVLK